MSSFKCVDCKFNTLHSKTDYYMVQNELWLEHTYDFGGRGMLCISCLEERVGRELIRSDFMDVPCTDKSFEARALEEL